MCCLLFNLQRVFQAQKKKHDSWRALQSWRSQNQAPISRWCKPHQFPDGTDLLGLLRLKRFRRTAQGMAAEAPRVVLERLALVVEKPPQNHGLIGGFTRILRPQLWGVLKIMGMILLTIVIIPGIGWICFKISKCLIYFSIWRNIQMSSKNWKIPSAV